MRSNLVSALAAVAAAAVIGCGGEDEPTTTEPSGPTPHDPGVGAEGGPRGELRAGGIGTVEVGASEDEVAEAFGEPIDKLEVDFGAGKSAPQMNWIYRFSDGDVTIKFDNRSESFAAYDVYTTELATEDGIKVGDEEAVLRKRYGDRLAESPLGLDSLVLSEGEPGSSPALTFALKGGKVMAISGGDIVQPAGE